MNPEQLVRRRRIYSGRVQGVGFRYTAVRVAARCDVVGYVRNLPDGRVELEAEGASAEVDGFLDAVNEELGGYIRETTTQDVPPTKRDDSFDIRY